MATQPNTLSHDEIPEEKGYLEIRSDRIVPFEGQPRQYFSDESIAELADSIEAEGQNQPVQLCKNRIQAGMKHTSRKANEANAPFKLIDGERRWRACQLIAKRNNLDFFLMKATIEIVEDEAEHFRKSFSANFGHEEMVPLDIAAGLQRIREDEPGVTYEELAKRYQKSVTFVINYLSLNNLCDEVKAMMDPSIPKRQRLNVSNAILIARVKNHAMQKEFANEALDDRLSVADVKDVVEGTILRDRTHVVRPITDFQVPSDGFPGTSPAAIEHRSSNRRNIGSRRAVFTKFLNSTETRITGFVKRNIDGTFDIDDIYDEADNADELFRKFITQLESIETSCQTLREALQKAKK